MSRSQFFLYRHGYRHWSVSVARKRYTVSSSSGKEKCCSQRDDVKQEKCVTQSTAVNAIQCNSTKISKEQAVLNASNRGRTNDGKPLDWRPEESVKQNAIENVSDKHPEDFMNQHPGIHQLTSRSKTTDLPSNIESVQTKGGHKMDESSHLVTLSERPKGFMGYIFWRYNWYLQRLQQSLETEMPKTFHMFRIFSVGIKAFATDFVDYVKVMVNLSFPNTRMEDLNLRELELYKFMPRDMIKVFPVLAVSAVPFGQNIALPLGYFFPRQLLCRHFWDLQQTHDFSLRFLRQRVYNARPLFRCLQAAVETIEHEKPRQQAQDAWYKLGSGIHPTTEEVLALKPLFTGHPFSLRAIRRNHLNTLLRLHGLWSPIWGRGRLKDHARWLLCLDMALVAEAVSSYRSATSARNQATGFQKNDWFLLDDQKLATALASLHIQTLKNNLLTRGINPVGLDSGDMAALLLRWIEISRKLSRQDYSLLLHLPVLLYYNHPTNLAIVAQ